MLADGYFEGMYKGKRVAVSSYKKKVQVFVGGCWKEVAEREVEVAFTLIRYNKEGQVDYKASDTLSRKNLPECLPSGWLGLQYREGKKDALLC